MLVDAAGNVEVDREPSVAFFGAFGAVVKIAGIQSGGEEDEAIWQRFRTARRRFSSRRSKHYAELKRTWSAARKTKEALIRLADRRMYEDKASRKTGR